MRLLQYTTQQLAADDRRPFTPPPRVRIRSCLRVQAKHELAQLEKSLAPIKHEAAAAPLFLFLLAVGRLGSTAKFIAAAAAPRNSSRLQLHLALSLSLDPPTPPLLAEIGCALDFHRGGSP